MPPSSRKRNKGKERKAKKVENERLRIHNTWFPIARGNSLIRCDHGFAEVSLLSDFDHPVSSFLNEYYMQLRRDFDIGLLRKMFDTHPQIWNDTNNREMLLNVLIRIGTNLLLVDNPQSPICKFSELLSCLARIIISLEEYSKTKNIDLANLSQCVAANRLFLIPKGSIYIRRDLLKFYRRRTSCSCLKKMHLEARKTLPKMGLCFGCVNLKDRASLSDCSRCKIGIGYCSRQCQVAHWPDHKGRCMIP